MGILGRFSLGLCISLSFLAEAKEADMLFLPQGKYKPFVAEKSETRSETEVPGFYLDTYLVTNQDFLKFVKENPDWRKTQIKSIFAGSRYLETWESDLKYDSKIAKSPVVHVSWFAANAYCESIGKELPTTDQWEYALADGGKNTEKLKEKILAWYGKPTTGKIAAIGSAGKNAYGVSDLGLLVWEWTQDFNSFMVVADLRDIQGKDSNLYCGSGSQMGDASDYAAFMRYSFRSSLKAHYTTANLGFRCAKRVLK